MLLSLILPPYLFDLQVTNREVFEDGFSLFCRKFMVVYPTLLDWKYLKQAEERTVCLCSDIVRHCVLIPRAQLVILARSKAKFKLALTLLVSFFNNSLSNILPDCLLGINMHIKGNFFNPLQDSFHFYNCMFLLFFAYVFTVFLFKLVLSNLLVFFLLVFEENKKPAMLPGFLILLH